MEMPPASHWEDRPIFAVIRVPDFTRIHLMGWQVPPAG
jgi:hypothetical protein